MYKKTVLVLLGHGPDQKRQIQGQEDDAVAAAKPEARAREEDEEREQRDHEDEHWANDVVGGERMVRAEAPRRASTRGRTGRICSPVCPVPLTQSAA